MPPWFLNFSKTSLINVSVLVTFSELIFDRHKRKSGQSALCHGRSSVCLHSFDARKWAFARCCWHWQSQCQLIQLYNPWEGSPSGFNARRTSSIVSASGAMSCSTPLTWLISASKSVSQLELSPDSVLWDRKFRTAAPETLGFSLE